MKKSKIATIPDFKTIGEFQEFWDSHDLSDYWEKLEEVSFAVDIRRRKNLVAVDPELLAKVRNQAKVKGISSESLINVWITEKLLKTVKSN